MNNNWYLQIQSKVFTQVEYMMLKKYPKINCTTRNQNGLPSQFPTLFLHELAPVEAGMDLTNETVNAVLSTIEIQVWTNTTENDCRQIIADAISQMKLLNYNVIALPLVKQTDKVYWGVARCRRMVGNGDKLVN